MVSRTESCKVAADTGLPWQWILPGGAVLIVGIAAAAYLGIRKRNANKSCE